MHKNSGNKIPSGLLSKNTTKILFDMLPTSYKRRIGIQLIVILVGGVFLLHLGGANLKGILIGLPLSIVILSMGIIAGLRCVKNVLTEKERQDLEDLQNWKIFQVKGSPLPNTPGNNIFLNFIVIIANTFRWIFFLIFSFSISYFVFLHNDISVGFYMFCFFALLWFPMIDNLFLKELNYVGVTFFKFMAMICIAALFKAVNLL